MIITLLLTGCSLKKEDIAVPTKKTESNKQDFAGVEENQVLLEEEGGPQKEEGAPQEQAPSQREESPAPDQGSNDHLQTEAKELTFEDALTLAKEKVHPRSFIKKPTDEQREALALILAHENFFYLAAQSQGLISNFKYAAGETKLNISVYTTKEMVGKDLLQAHPLKLSGNPAAEALDPKVLSPDALGDQYDALRLLNKEIIKAEEYLQSAEYLQANPAGKMRIQLHLGDAQSVSKELVEQILAHYLSIEEVVWVELAFAEKIENIDPTTTHPFWEYPEKITYEQARLMALEKLHERINEKLSLRERKAFYIISAAYAQYMIDEKSYADAIRLATTDQGAPLAPLEDFPSGYEQKGGYFTTQYATIKEYSKKMKDEIFYINLPKRSVSKQTSYGSLFIAPTPQNKITIELHQYSEPLVQGAPHFSIDRSVVYPALLRHYWSIDCVSWVEMDYQEIYPGLVEADVRFN